MTALSTKLISMNAKSNATMSQAPGSALLIFILSPFCMLVSPLHLRGDFIAAPFPPGRHARHPRLAGIAHALCRQCVDRRRADGRAVTAEIGKADFVEENAGCSARPSAAASRPARRAATRRSCGRSCRQNPARRLCPPDLLPDVPAFFFGAPLQAGPLCRSIMITMVIIIAERMQACWTPNRQPTSTLTCPG